MALALQRNFKVMTFIMFFTITLSFFPSLAQAIEPPVSYDFGEVELRSTSKTAVSISTSSNGNVSITLLELENGTDFKVITQVLEGGILIPPNETVDIEIAFSPTVLGSLTDTLSIRTNNPFVGKKLVYLSGTGISKEDIAIEDILDFFDSAVASGKLIGDDGGKLTDYQLSYSQNKKKSDKERNSAENRLNALRNMIKSADNMVQDGNLDGACEQIFDVYHKTDGQSPPDSAPDFVAGEAKEDLADMIFAFSQILDCK